MRARSRSRFWRAPRTTGPFIPPLVMDPFDPDVLYFGTERLYRTTDGGERWEPIAEAPVRSRRSASICTTSKPSRKPER